MIPHGSAGLKKKCERYNLLRAYIQNSNQQIANKIIAPYKKIWHRLSIADNGQITLDCIRQQQHDKNCQECSKYMKNRAPTESSSVQSVPVQHIEAEIFIFTDKCSGYVVTKHITDIARNRITNQLTEWFNLLGWPHSMGTKEDNMFHTKFTQFCQNKNIEQTTKRPETTDKGIAKTAIKSAKQLLIRCILEETDFQTALANMRNEPAGTGPSARQILMGAEQIESTPEEEEPQQKAQEKDPKTKQDNLEVGDKVITKHQRTGCWNKEVEVVGQRDDKLSYVIRDDTGQILIHGQHLLKPKLPPLARSDRVLCSHTRQ